jgi:two-component system chemotaxis sensor kinase CheA
VERLTAVPFGATAAGVVESAPAWAASQGTSVSVQVEPRALWVPQALARVLPGVLSHLVRNAIAHGIESPEERAAAGKPEQGTIRIVATELARGVCVTVEDDGRGLDEDAIVAQSGPQGDWQASANSSELIFRPGVTTRRSPDPLAGRGVGLHAVRQEFERIHYEVSATFEPGRWTRFTIAPEVANRANKEESHVARSQNPGH